MLLKRRPKHEDLRPKTPWTKTKTSWTKTKTQKTPLTKTTDANRWGQSGNLLRRFGNVVEFPLQYLVVIIKSITYLSFRFLWKYFACKIRDRLSRLDVAIPYCSVKSWFAIALAEIRTRRILREKADCKQYNVEPKKRAVDAFPQTPTTRPKHVWWSLQDKSCHKPFWLSGLPWPLWWPLGSSRLPLHEGVLFMGGRGGGGGEGGKSSLLWPLLASEIGARK